MKTKLTDSFKKNDACFSVQVSIETWLNAAFNLEYGISSGILASEYKFYAVYIK